MKDFFKEIKASFKRAFKEVPRLYFLPITAVYNAYKDELSKCSIADSLAMPGIENIELEPQRVTIETRPADF